MKKIVAIAVLSVVLPAGAHAQVQVDGYMRRDGTYVQPYVRSAPDDQKWNNYGSGNGNGMSSPYSRDSDSDGIPNFQDRDDDNDGTQDNQDNSQYGTGYGN